MKTGFDSAINAAEDRGERALARRLKAEKRMSVALVTACLKRGFVISVSDGEDWPVKRSENKAEILAALFSTDEDVIVIRTEDGVKAGWFQLIYGNDGHDVVSDYSSNDTCDAIWNEVLRPLSDKIEMAA
ncbi:hypothetical protein [Rhizobium sp.]|jgi:hypothetical protein|uniref:hypothetical protein n=1 Tax=Rhizobium sp. TaxID=391 RepID=UPI0028AE1EAA|nr:hypothetical protein [Xanthobacteraceae bacterium]MCW5796285.1 hypothetical protein [Nitrospira sp.]MCW5886490.1 hypothetical protein [Anaerolineales bacterium]